MSDYTDHESDMFFILYNGRYTDHKSNMDPFCIMSDTQITSPTWWSFCKCQIYRSQVPSSFCINVRCRSRGPTWLSFCKCQITQITSPSSFLYNVRCLDSWSASDIYTEWWWDLWSVYLTFTEWPPRWTRDLHLTLYRNDDGLVICVIWHLQNDNHVGPRDLCIWTLYRMAFHVGTSDLYLNII